MDKEVDMPTEEEAAAKAGAKLLDATADEMPHLVAPGWAERTDLGLLDQGIGSHCVIGQSMPDWDFFDACEALGVTELEQMVETGFWAREMGSYRALTQAWTNEILDRRAAGRAVNPVGDPAI